MSLKTAAQSEPVVTASAIAGIVTAGIALLVAFGVDITDAQTAAIVGFVGVVAPIVGALLARRKVTPVQPQHRA